MHTDAADIKHDKKLVWLGSKQVLYVPVLSVEMRQSTAGTRDAWGICAGIVG